MYHSYTNYDELIQSLEYDPKSVITNDTEYGGTIIGYIPKLKIWELNKYTKVDTGNSILNKPIYKFVRCMEIEPITSTNKDDLINIIIEELKG